jgi:hypothetical protein
MPDRTLKSLGFLTKRPRSGMVPYPGTLMILFGGVFVIVGIVIMIVGPTTDLVRDKPMPVWLPILFGAIFVTSGLQPLSYGIRHVRGRLRKKRLLTENPQEPWTADHPWSPAGEGDRSHRKALHMLLLALHNALGVALFLGFFHAFGFFKPEAADTPVDIAMPILVLGVSSAALAGFLCVAVYHLLRRRRYGAVTVQFKRFPFFLGERLEATLAVPEGVDSFRRFSVTLRCVEESMGKKGGMGNSLRCYQCHADTIDLGAGRSMLGPDEPIAVAFDLPADAPSTQLAEKFPTYWELVIRIKLRGIDYFGEFLMPVYAKRMAGIASASQ